MEQKEAFPSIKCLIEGHKGTQIIAICTNHKCKEPKLLCTRCALHNHKTCSDYVILFEDILNDDFTQMISHPCFENIQEIFDSFSTPNPDVFKDFEKFLDEELTLIRTSFEKLLSDSRTRLIKAFEKAVNGLQTDPGFKNMKISEFTDLDPLKKFLKEIGSDNQYNTDEKTEKINEFFNNYWQQYNVRTSNVKDLFNPQIQSLLTDIHGKSNNMRKNYQKFEEGLLLRVLNDNLVSFTTKDWRFDTSAKHPDILIDGDGFTLTKRNSSGHAPIYGNYPFLKGVYRWEVTVSGITAPNGDWVQFGLIEKTKIPVEKFEYSTNYSLTSGGYYLNHFVGVAGIYGTAQNFNNQTFLCEYNADLGVLTITGKAIKAEAKNLQGMNLYPFVDLFHPGNTAKVKIL